ncbi:MAG: GNAT family N-acetyltransferase [Deltaproteobacteria bacterium]|nr:GNAT family N-acetyltransferase [Deltaproteobacteria bacterium]
MTFHSIIIRKAGLSDINQMVGLLEELFSIEEDFAFNETTQRNGLAVMLGDNEKGCIMVAASGEQVIGMISAQLLVSTAEGGMVALIEDMVVAKLYRGQGIGKKLLLSIEKWTNKKGAKRIQLLADRNNFHALGFYKKQKWASTQLTCLRKNF